MALSRADLTLEPSVEVMADGREVIIRRLGALERAEYQGLCADKAKATEGEPMSARLRAMKVLEGELVARTVLNADGTPMFKDGEDAASALPEHDLDELGLIAVRVNRMGPSDPNA